MSTNAKKLLASDFQLLTFKSLRDMVGSIMEDEYTTDWCEILDVISHPRRKLTDIFIIRYAFQALAHNIWKECNVGRHEE